MTACPMPLRPAFKTLLPLLLAAVIAACGERAAAPDALAQAPGQWLLINYWAEWCKPCAEEIPELNAFAAKHAPRVRVLMVNFDGVTGEPLRQQASRLGIRAELLEADPAARFGLQPPQVLPATVLVTPQGTAVPALLGPQTVASLEAALAAAAAPATGGN